MEKNKEVHKGKRSAIQIFLGKVEAVGNRLPPPSIIFICLCVFIILLSGIGGPLGWSATGMVLDTKTKELAETTLNVKSLISIDGLKYMLTHVASNFTSFPSVGSTCTIMLAIGVAEQSGWMDGLIRKAVSITPSMLVTPLVVFIGVESNICENAGYMVFVPLAAMIFKACGKHPIAGIAAGFAGVSGGYSANLLMGSIDASLAGLTQSAAQTMNADYIVNPTCNWFFMFTSVALVVGIGTFVTEKIVIPMLGSYKEGNGDGSLAETREYLTEKEEKALKVSNWLFVGMVVLLIVSCIPSNSFMRNEETGSLINNSLLINAIIPIFTILFMFPGIVYGKLSGNIKTQRELGNAFTGSFRTISGFLATAFFASQFTNYFKYTLMGNVLAIKGSEVLNALNVGWIPLLIVFIIFCGFINLMMPQASAKWAIFAPVFVPMFMNLGISPELTQCAYRISDSSMNILCPVLSSLPIILASMKRYEKDSGFGTLVSCMLPYSMSFLIFWTALLIIWGIFGLPLGPGVSALL